MDASRYRAHQIAEARLKEFYGIEAWMLKLAIRWLSSAGYLAPCELAYMMQVTDDQAAVIIEHYEDITPGARERAEQRRLARARGD